MARPARGLTTAKERKAHHTDYLRDLRLAKVILLNLTEHLDSSLLGCPRRKLYHRDEIALILLGKKTARKLHKKPTCRSNDGRVKQQIAACSRQCPCDP
jgi:hypothetical protein